MLTKSLNKYFPMNELVNYLHTLNKYLLYYLNNNSLFFVRSLIFITDEVLPFILYHLQARHMLDGAPKCDRKNLTTQRDHKLVSLQVDDK